MNKKQLILLILWISLVVGLVLFAIIYIAIAQHNQAVIENGNNELTQIFYLLTARRV